MVDRPSSTINRIVLLDVRVDPVVAVVLAFNFQDILQKTRF